MLYRWVLLYSAYRNALAGGLSGAHRVLKEGVDESFDKGFMASLVWPAWSSKGGHLKAVGDDCINKEVK